MKIHNLVLGLLITATSALSQKLHSPAEILKIMNDSKLQYQIKFLEKPESSKDYSSKLNRHDVYRVNDGSNLSTYAYNPNEKSKPFFEKAEGFFQSNPDSARVYYELALKADSTLSLAMTYIGQTFESKSDLNNAMVWYKKAISKNYIDYMAHWFLADAYLNTGKVNDALDEIALARILNRNHPRIAEAMSNILSKANKTTQDWYFAPQVKLQKTSEENISVEMDSIWTGYGLAKALWDFEPGYRASMGVKEGMLSTVECKECLIPLLMLLDNGKGAKTEDPQLKVLLEASKQKMLDQYILYEIFLPENPQVAYQLPEQTILGIKDYILKVRNK